MAAAKPVVLVRGGGDLGTGVALRLHRAGWRVIVTELPQPLVIRRAVAFASAVYDYLIQVEGTIGRRIQSDKIEFEAEACWEVDQVPVVVDPNRSAAAR